MKLRRKWERERERECVEKIFEKEKKKPKKEMILQKKLILPWPEKGGERVKVM